MVKTMVCSSLWSAFCTDCSSHKNFWIKFWPTLIIPSSLSRTMWKHSLLLFLPDRYFIESALRCPHFNYAAFFPPKRSRRWNFGKGEARNGWMPFLDFHCRSEQMTNFSTEEHLPTPRFRVNSALWPVPYACAQPYHHSSGSPYWG